MYTQSLSGTLLGVLRGSEGGTWVKIPHIWANIINGREKEWFNQIVTLTKVLEYAQIYTRRISGTIFGVLRCHGGSLGEKSKIWANIRSWRQKELSYILGNGTFWLDDFFLLQFLKFGNILGNFTQGPPRWPQMVTGHKISHIMQLLLVQHFAPAILSLTSFWYDP